MVETDKVSFRPGCELEKQRIVVGLCGPSLVMCFVFFFNNRKDTFRKMTKQEWCP